MMTITRVPPVDRLTEGDESLLLYEHQVIRLGLIGTVIFDATAQPITLAALSALLDDVIGSPVTGTILESTAAAVEQLQAQGVLRVSADPDL